MFMRTDGRERRDEAVPWIKQQPVTEDTRILHRKSENGNCTLIVRRVCVPEEECCPKGNKSSEVHPHTRLGFRLSGSHTFAAGLFARPPRERRAQGRSALKLLDGVAWLNIVSVRGI